MTISVFDLYTIGIGPSSSHTVGPMRAAFFFVQALKDQNLINQVTRVQIELFGSLGLTGKGHGSDRGILLGLEGEAPEGVNADTMFAQIDQIYQKKQLSLLGCHQISFLEKTDLLFHRTQKLPHHSNGMKCTAFAADQTEILVKTYYSIGGGFVVLADGAGKVILTQERAKPPYPFQSGAELLKLCQENNLSIAELVMQNEMTWNTASEIRYKLLKIWEAMQACVDRGLRSPGILPGGLKVKRRAPELYQKLMQGYDQTPNDVLMVMDWVNLFALSVSEENAVGGRVVTAPTNGAAGVIPAVLHYYNHFHVDANEEKIMMFLLTAAAIGMLYKQNASISGAEVGCQGEVGVACSMAAAGLAAVMGGSNEQIENAAEIGMEHNLGLTCDPIGGLVQIPCIERNAMASTKAINAARLALNGDGTHKVSLDKVIKTMFQTGKDMQDKYKETSRGGLAINIVEC